MWISSKDCGKNLKFYKTITVGKQISTKNLKKKTQTLSEDTPAEKSKFWERIVKKAKI